jgi:hypothetical protein
MNGFKIKGAVLSHFRVYGGKVIFLKVEKIIWTFSYLQTCTYLAKEKKFRAQYDTAELCSLV